MNPETSAMLTRLSEQELDRLQLELAEIDREQSQCHERHLQAVDALLSLHERLRAASATRLSDIAQLHAAIEEQRARVAERRAALDRALQRRRALLARMNEARRAHHARKRIHESGLKAQSRRQMLEEQRRLDDLFAARLSRPAGSI